MYAGRNAGKRMASIRSALRGAELSSRKKEGRRSRYALLETGSSFGD
jgi:hypothetical protein